MEYEEEPELNDILAYNQQFNEEHIINLAKIAMENFDEKIDYYLESWHGED